jgi:disintegrin and metalloproteinase domain-containing protein 10
MMAQLMAVTVLALMTFAHGRITSSPLNKQIRHYELLDVPSKHLFNPASPFFDRRQIAPFTLPLTLFNRSYSLKLAPALHLFSDDATVVYTNKDGITSTEKISPLGYYTGKIEGVEQSYVHLHVEKDGTTHGMVIEGEEGYHIEPSHEHFDEEQDKYHLVYRESDFDYVKGGKVAHHHEEHVRENEDNTESAVSRNRRFHADKECAEPDRTCVEKSQFDADKKGTACHMALWADKPFVEEYKVAGAIRIMTQRMSVVDQIFRDANIKPSNSGLPVNDVKLDVPISLKVKQITIGEGVTMPTGTAENPDPKPFLEAFGEGRDIKKVEHKEMDWKEYCLAAAFTYHDFRGTLGLAWVAAQDEANANGGICTGQYVRGGVSKSLNTAFTSSKNFGSKQPEMQSALVLAHELGHNFGATHDKEVKALAEDGSYLMYPFAAKGTDKNNDLFSAQSKQEMNAVVYDRGGCFEKEGESNRCGDFKINGNEKCDCGAQASTCNALDTCCTTECKFGTGSVCSPLDTDHGGCCTTDCQFAPEDTVCKKASVCQSSSKCGADGKCPDVKNRANFALCEAGITDCKTCTGLCSDPNDGGPSQCTNSICAIWDQEPCKEFGEGACKIKCRPKGSTNNDACRDPSTLEGDPSQYPKAKGYENILKWNGEADEVTTDGYLTNKKPGGATCEFKEGQATSGLCNSDSECEPADKSETSLDELRKEYENAKRSVEQYFAEDQGGLKRWQWLIVGGILLLCCCFTTCHFTNKKKKEHMQDSRGGDKYAQRGKKIEG